MTPQAENSIRLYRGNSTSTIETALKMQKKSVVDELMRHYNTLSTKELAIKLSIG